MGTQHNFQELAWLQQDRGNPCRREWCERRATGRDLWLEWHRDGVALYAGPQAARDESDGESRARERNCNIYSLTCAGGEGRRAKIVLSSVICCSGAVERTRRIFTESTANKGFLDSRSSCFVLGFCTLCYRITPRLAASVEQNFLGQRFNLSFAQECL